MRVLVDGAWGFTACPWRTPDAVVELAHDAVAQARVNARSGPRQTVELAPVPVARGTWETPVRIDPFAIPLEEKLDFLTYIQQVGRQHRVFSRPWSGVLEINRQERVLATSDGTLVTQTCYETGMEWEVQGEDPTVGRADSSIQLTGLTTAARGWELILDADIPGQLQNGRERIQAAIQAAVGTRPASVGRYTLVCDGTTMAALLEQTLGVATQLDRALGYEANAVGTSFITDPLTMVGHLQIAAPMVTVMANRNAPTELATVAWDDEGVVPEAFTIVQDGFLVDFQTTREQATWLAPYYARKGHPVRSHGCAAAEQASDIQLQMTPNLALVPGKGVVGIEDLVADVAQGVLVTDGDVRQMDSQARTGLLLGKMREIRNGRLGGPLEGGGVQFDSQELWKHVTALGGAATEGGVVSPRKGGAEGNWGFLFGMSGIGFPSKGEPAQSTSHSTRAVAAIIPNQPVINPRRRA